MTWTNVVYIRLKHYLTLIGWCLQEQEVEAGMALYANKGTLERTFLLMCSHCKCSAGAQGADSFPQFDIEISSLKANHQCS